MSSRQCDRTSIVSARRDLSEESQGCRPIQLAGRHERDDEPAGLPTVAKHLVRTEAADVQISVRAEIQTERTRQATALRRHEGVDERTRASVESKHLVRSAAADVEVGVRAEDDSPREI